jgi:prophage regulatory protein
MPDRILKLQDVKNRTGLSRSAIYRQIGFGTFPAPRLLGERSVGWLESEINDWITNLKRKDEI